MAGIGKALRGFGRALKRKASIQIGKRNIESKKLFEKARARSKEKALEIKQKKQYIKRNPHEGVPSQSSDWPYWRGDE